MKAQIVFFMVALLSLPAFAQSADAGKINEWLVLGPAALLADGAALPGGAGSALDYEFLEPSRLRPETGAKVQWDAQRQLSWRPGAARFAATGARQAVYLAVYLESRRWLQADLVVDAAFPLRIYLDGAALARSGETGSGSYPLTLPTGKHLLLIKGILSPLGNTAAKPTATPQGDGATKLTPASQGDAAAKPTAAPGGGIELSLHASLKNKPAFAADPLRVSLGAERRTAMEDVLNAVSINEVFISPDGRRVAVALSQLPRGGSASRRWLEILDTDNGARVFTSQALGAIGNFQWLGDSHRFSFTREEKELSDLCIYDLSDHSSRTLLAGLKNLSACWWADDGSFLVYATGEEADKDKPYRHVRKLDDRFSSPESRQALTLFLPASGARQPLTAAADNFSQVRISPDRRTLLLASYNEDPGQRPYHRNVLVLYSLADGRREKVLDDPWINDFAWSPDSKKLLLLGGASAFAGLGNTLAPGTVPNDYDVQAYVFDLKTRQAEALTRKFAPAVDSAFWHPGGSLFLKVTDADYSRLYRCAPREKRFSRLETIPEAVESVSWSRAGRAAYSGSGLGAPQGLYVVNLDGGGSRLLKDYNQAEFGRVRFGRHESWSFKTKAGRTIGGYLCYPPDFDPARLYPCIVNYYGGTTPIGRNFGGRYPKDWYAANGYIVCVLQPSGAIGYGQEFSSVHVNDWGEITSEEIIRGVEELLRTHPFIDNRRLGAIGASYGGFMTQVLAAKTELFAAFISHAGISSLASYWGVGDWGYDYSAVASANSFPWNRKDIYVGHSPLFMAERIKKPLLLLHGEDDNNVPPGESYQMFAALKLQGKPVSLVTFPGQQHFILAPAQRMRWLQTIMAWFDRWLKGQPEWWNELYPE